VPPCRCLTSDKEISGSLRVRSRQGVSRSQSFDPRTQIISIIHSVKSLMNKARATRDGITVASTLGNCHPSDPCHCVWCIVSRPSLGNLTLYHTVPDCGAESSGNTGGECNQPCVLGTCTRQMLFRYDSESRLLEPIHPHTYMCKMPVILLSPCMYQRLALLAELNSSQIHCSYLGHSRRPPNTAGMRPPE
jgi:hypothetical protein